MSKSPGSTKGFLGLFFRLRRGLIKHDAYYVGEMDESVPRNLAAPVVDVEYRLATVEDIADLFDWDGSPLGELREQKARDVISRGDGRCFLALHEGRIVHWRWYRYDYADFCGMGVKLGPAWAYLSGTCTLREYRRKGIQNGLSMFQQEHLEESALKSLLYIHTRNTRAQAVFNRRYYRHLGRFHRFTLFGRWEILLVPRWLKGYVSEPATAEPSRPPAAALTSAGD